VIRVRHLTHKYGDREVVRDISFRVRKGEIFGFIGPNGAGKTTTIRIMSTLMEPTSGRVEIDGIDVEVDPEGVRRRIGYMADHPGVYERVTVGEYLDFFAAAYRVPLSERASTVAAVVELTDLGPLRERLVAELSKGMKQRIQLARTLLHDPKVLILDEPASDLDPRARIEIRDLLVELQSMGKTVFLSSHILTELADVCTSIAILERGRLVVSGPIHEIARRLEGTQAAQAAAAHAEAQAQAPGPPPGHAPGAAYAPPGPAMPAPPPTRSVKLKVLAPGEAVAAVLGGIPGVFKVAPGAGGTVVVSYGGDEQLVAAIVRALVMGGIPVVGVEPERNELERIFLEVTKGEVQ
jgi:ABC-2 type transport system ATP-binding protein